MRSASFDLQAGFVHKSSFGCVRIFSVLCRQRQAQWDDENKFMCRTYLWQPLSTLIERAGESEIHNIKVIICVECGEPERMKNLNFLGLSSNKAKNRRLNYDKQRGNNWNGQVPTAVRTSVVEEVCAFCCCSCCWSLWKNKFSDCLCHLQTSIRVCSLIASRRRSQIKVCCKIWSNQTMFKL